MKKLTSASLFTTLGCALVPATLLGCADDTDPPPTDPTEVVIDEDTTWSGEVALDLPTFVVGGATLTIAPGTTIRGANGSVLVVTTEGRLDAEGTAAAPIVFTSAQATPASGDWGGVVLLGTAAINADGGSVAVEGFAAGVDATRISYGGSADAHDCGTLAYARIEYAGYALNMDNELNGLTLGACGEATDVHHVQIHRGLDDGLEIFGGTVGVRHILITLPQDDGLDWDQGWTGSAQHLIVQQSATRGNRGIEADSNEDAPDTATPRSAPELWNISLIGGGAEGVDQGGMHLRRGTAGRIHNAVVTNFATFAIDIGSDASEAAWADGSLAVESSYLFNAPAVGPLWSAEFDDDSFDEAAEFALVATVNLAVDPMLAAPMDTATPNFAPMIGSPVLTGCATPPAGFDTAATYCGAVGAVDWTAGWAAYPD